MNKTSRDPGLSLLQQNPSRELLLEKMRSKLATTPAAAMVRTEHKKEARQRSGKTWTTRGLILAGIVAINYFAIGNKDLIASKISRRAVASLPVPSDNLSTDEQAMYYVFALYDYPRLKETYGVKGFFAIDQAYARRQLDDLLPDVSPKALGEISKYMPVAFKTISGRRTP
jgi:hypothetical protein